MEGKWREEEDEYERRCAAPATARRGDLPALEVTSVQAKRLKDRAVISTRALAEPAIAEVSVRFEFPDGSVAEGRFMQGQTVEVLKAWLESEFGLPMREVDLELNNRSMADPLSLNDFGVDLCQGLEVYVILADDDKWRQESKGK